MGEGIRGEVKVVRNVHGAKMRNGRDRNGESNVGVCRSVAGGGLAGDDAVCAAGCVAGICEDVHAGERIVADLGDAIDQFAEGDVAFHRFGRYLCGRLVGGRGCGGVRQVVRNTCLNTSFYRHRGVGGDDVVWLKI